MAEQPDDDIASYEEIMAEDDLALLLEWHECAMDVLDNIKARISAAAMAGASGSQHEDWVRRASSKAGFAGSAVRRIERRIVSLGGDLPLTVERSERERIGRLQARVRALEAFLRKNGFEVT